MSHLVAVLSPVMGQQPLVLQRVRMTHYLMVVERPVMTHLVVEELEVAWSPIMTH